MAATLVGLNHDGDHKEQSAILQARPFLEREIFIGKGRKRRSKVGEF